MHVSFTHLFYSLVISMAVPVSLMAQEVFDIQGHRGCRGLMPENTLPAFFRAIELGFTTLEMDVVLSKDDAIVVSHEPWMSSDICSHPDGRPVRKSEEKKLNLYQMTYDEIQQYDCGQRFHPRFPDQKKMQTIKPTLNMVVKSVERFAKEGRYAQPAYNIEIKSDPRLYERFQPDPKTLTIRIVEEIRRLGIEDITTLQSFDLAILEALHMIPDHTFSISYLVARGKDVRKNLAQLTFTPDIYSPLYKMVKGETVQACHERSMKIIPWTVNDRGEVSRLKALGCDGVISDYFLP